VRAGIGAPGNAVAVDVEVAAEVLAGIQHLGGHHLAAVVARAVVPVEGLAQAVVHADVEVEQDEDRRLQAVGQIEGLRAERRSTRSGLRETAAHAWCRRARRRRRIIRSDCWVRVGMPVDGPPRCTSKITAGTSAK
jgi:hypothetical protein